MDKIKKAVKVLFIQGKRNAGRKLHEAVKAYEAGKITRETLKSYYYQLFT